MGPSLVAIGNGHPSARARALVLERPISLRPRRKTYAGTRTTTSAEVVVTEMSGDGVASSTKLDPRFDLHCHSEQLEWGGCGRPSAQLALALLADHIQDDARALALHHRFKLAVVSLLPYDGWVLNSQDVAAALTEFFANRRAVGRILEDGR